MSMMEGLQCLSPTISQCHEMMVQCVCPVNGEAIDSWETPCEPQANAVYMYDHSTQRCLTCDQYLAMLPLEPDDPAQPTAEEQTGPYAPGDFPCRLGGPFGDQMEIDCVTIDGGNTLLASMWVQSLERYVRILRRIQKRLLSRSQRPRLRQTAVSTAAS